MQTSWKKIDIIALLSLVIAVIGLFGLYPVVIDQFKSNYDVQLAQANDTDTLRQLSIRNNNGDIYIKDIFFFDRHITSVLPFDTSYRKIKLSWLDRGEFKILSYDKPVLFGKDQNMQFELIMSRQDRLSEENIEIRRSGGTFYQDSIRHANDLLWKALLVSVAIGILLIIVLSFRVFLLRRRLATSEDTMMTNATGVGELGKMLDTKDKEIAELNLRIDQGVGELAKTQNENRELLIKYQRMAEQLSTETGNVRAANDIIAKVISKTRVTTKGNGNVLKNRIQILSTDSLESKAYIPIGLFNTWTTIVRIWLQNKTLSPVKEVSDSYCQYDKIKNCNSLSISDRLRRAIKNSASNLDQKIKADSKFNPAIKSVFHSSPLVPDGSDFLISRIIIGAEEELLHNDIGVLINFYESFHIPIFFINKRTLISKAEELLHNGIEFWYNGPESDLFIVGDEYFQGYIPTTPSWNTLDMETIDKYFSLLEDRSLGAMLAYDAKQFALHKNPPARA